MSIRIRIGIYSFEPGFVPTAAAAGLVALTLWLGNWQLGRAEEKRGRQALLEARMHDNPVRLTGAVPGADALLYRHVRVAGTWMPEAQIFIDNQIRDGRAGFTVITPVAIEGSGAAVLVNRGWVERSRAYPRPPEVATPSGHADVSGLAMRPPARYLELGAGETVSGNVWQNLSIERVASATKLVLLPVVVLQEPAGEGLALVRETPDAGVAKHVEYAFTWFALAATALALWFALNLKRNP
jgi:surfeit locus 1 family protein